MFKAGSKVRIQSAVNIPRSGRELRIVDTDLKMPKNEDSTRSYVLCPQISARVISRHGFTLPLPDPHGPHLISMDVDQERFKQHYFDTVS